MGRGRQKAKQTKVARELKYSTYEPNYRALEQELTSRKTYSGLATTEDSPEPESDDYAGWVDDER
ncbi:DUF3073 domain-containing protein [Cellulomonas carbonis]|uniref:DUF3073 domain-containing protein n=1 Tax=Cellulomonas carbonis T26 TaxID=947969 RepID=A0A0A0BWM7_9CELL|nr:DUF3073 domain-containing protein [Cellulomonas carbonis]KGM12375.1 hypothetical protein N868_14940 [Cellulomonas carbonis T26]MDT0166674.1 DUF3073 domain-containing protein [Actinotalea sp. AC32]GGC03792.1 hypothetical protein GCM10010972_16090 [Cellulomonas carbonis]